MREKIALRASIDKSVETASALISAHNSVKGATPLAAAPALHLLLDEGLALLEQFEKLQVEAELLRQEVVVAEREQQRMAPWVP